MKIADLERAKDLYTAKASDTVRQFSFAGIAVIWLLRIDKSVEPIPPSLAPVLTLFALSLAADLFHYAISSLIWACYYRKKLRDKVPETLEFSEPGWITIPGYTLFTLKIAFAIWAWVMLAKYLVLMWALL